MPTKPELLSPKDTYAYLGVGKSLFNLWDRDGVIPDAVKVGRSRRWRRAELKAWIESGCPRRADWKWLPGLMIERADLHALRLKQLAAMNAELVELAEQIKRGERFVHVSARG